VFNLQTLSANAETPGTRGSGEKEAKETDEEGRIMVKVEVKQIEQAATPDPNNINKHTQKGGGLLENSLRKRGAFRSIASAGKGVETPVIMAGNFTFEKAVDAGFTEVVNVHVTGSQLVNVVRDDLAPNSAEAIALGLEDNEIGKASYNPDLDILAAVMADPAMQTLKAEDKMLADIVEGMGLKVDDNYSRKIEAPIYTPKGDKPAISEMIDESRTKELLVEIDEADLPEEEKQFLRIAANRHTVLNFKRIAEYYAHSPAPVQKLMEDSALVIIDFKRAIELGYVKLSEEIAAQYLKDYPDA